MAKGSGKGGGVFNGPSKTGNPSGKGRGNNPPSSGFGGGGGGFGGGGSIGGARSYGPGNPTYDVTVAKIDARIQQTHDAAHAIRSAREELPKDQALKVEADIRGIMGRQQLVMLDRLLRAPENPVSKLLRGKK